jgi:glycosyltransferase involved in cell wall biosynthesis
VDGTYDLNPNRSQLRYRALESYSNRCLHQAIAVSEGTKQFWLARTGIAEHRIITIHNGIDSDAVRRRLARRDARQRLGLPDDGRVIVGGVGRLDVAKGFTHLIDAFAMVRAQCPDVLLVIAGTGPLQDRLASQVEALGLSQAVKFPGFCTDVGLVYDALDVFVLSSICDAMPFALLEAMAHDLPAVGTRVGGVPEVIVPGTTGFLAAPKDAAALAAGLIPLLQSDALRLQLGAAGRERVVKRFQEAEMVRRTVDVYRQLLISRPP